MEAKRSFAFSLMFVGHSRSDSIRSHSRSRSQGVVLTDFQSLLDCQSNLSLSQSLYAITCLTHTAPKVHRLCQRGLDHMKVGCSSPPGKLTRNATCASQPSTTFLCQRITLNHPLCPPPPPPPPPPPSQPTFNPGLVSMNPPAPVIP